MAMRLKFLALVALAFIGTTGRAEPESPDHPLEYEIVTNGVVNGTMTVSFPASGEVRIRNRYQSQDKIRELTVEVSMDAADLPTGMRRVGEAFAFHPIDESFESSRGRASWRNRIETGSSDRAQGRYYVPLGLAQAGDSAAYELGLLANALLRADNQRLNLLPVGTAQAAVVDEMLLQGETEAAHVRLVAIRGMGMEPDYVWLDAAGRFFAGRNAIRKGWRKEAGRLAQAVAAADEKTLGAAVARLPSAKTPGTILIRNVAVFDARTGRLLPNRSVLLSAGRIERIAGADIMMPTPPDAQLVDGRGLTLLPGLWDMHVHIKPREALRHLASGVTTVRDLGNDNEALQELEQRISTGMLPGPRILKAGFIEGLGPITTYTGTLVSSEAEALAAVDAYADKGYRQIKLYNAVRPEWVRPIADRAHARGLRLSGHVPMGATLARAVADGYDEIQHLIYPLLHFSNMPVASPLTFNAARAAVSIDLSSAKTMELVNILKRHGIAMDMTLTVYEPLFMARPGQPAPVFERFASRLPPAMLRQVAQGPLPTPPDLTDAQFQGAYAKALQLTRLFRQNGVQLLAGTDFAPLAGLALPRELELLVEAGLSPAESLRIATMEAAKLVGEDAASGIVEEGKVADLILVNGDPTRRIEAIRDIRLVIKGGVAYQPEALLAASGLEPIE